MKAIYFVSMFLSLAVSANQVDQFYDEKVIRHVDGLVKAMQYDFSKAIDKEFGSDDPADKKTLGNSKFYGGYGGMYGGMYGGYGGYGGMYGGYGGYGGMYGGGMYPYYGYGDYYPYYGGMDANPWTMWKRSTESSAQDQIKAEFNDQVLKPFRKSALNIVQGEVDAFNAGYSLKKRNDETFAAAERAAKATKDAAKAAAEAAAEATKDAAKSASGFFASMKGRFTFMGSRLKELFGALMKRFTDAKPLGKAGYAAAATLSVVGLVFFFRRLFMTDSEEIDE